MAVKDRDAWAGRFEGRAADTIVRVVVLFSAMPALGPSLL